MGDNEKGTFSRGAAESRRKPGRYGRYSYNPSVRILGIDPGSVTTGFGVIEQVKGVFLQTNPMLSRELNEVAAQLRVEYAPRSAQLMDQTARLYAQAFTEQELKDALAFYKSPLGRKIVAQEPLIFDDSLHRVQQWANQLSEEVMNRMRAEMKKKGHDL